MATARIRYFHISDTDDQATADRTGDANVDADADTVLLAPSFHGEGSTDEATDADCATADGDAEADAHSDVEVS